MTARRRNTLLYALVLPAALFLLLLLTPLKDELQNLTHSRAPPRLIPPAPPPRAASEDPDEFDVEADPDELAEEALDAATSPAPANAPPPDAPDKPHCFVYDRPPRTGSTTISRVIKPCMDTHGFVQPRAPSRQHRDRLMRNMFALSRPRIGMLSHHVYMSLDDVAALRNDCRSLFYVTSCKNVRERMWSGAKDFATRNGQPLTGKSKMKAIKRFSQNDRAEVFLEGYPYLYLNGTPLGVPAEERLVPDYVIRAPKLGEDLGKLLQVLKCNVTVQSHNVHKGPDEELDRIMKRPLRFGDATYSRLNALADDVNEEGLRKARVFLSSATDTDRR